LSRAESTAHFASGSIVPFASRESRGSMSPTRESLDTPYGFGVLGDYDAPRGDDFTARPGIRPSMDYSYMSGTRNEASPDLSTTESSREQATTPHAGEMREKRGASRALFGFNTRSNSEEVQPSSSNRSSGLQTRPRTTSLLLNKPESTSPQESDVDGSTLVIRHVDSGNRSGEPSMSRVVELPPEYADRSPVPSRLE
jgi:SLT domain-containing protein